MPVGLNIKFLMIYVNLVMVGAKVTKQHVDCGKNINLFYHIGLPVPLPMTLLTTKVRLAFMSLREGAVTTDNAV